MHQLLHRLHVLDAMNDRLLPRPQRLVQRWREPPLFRREIAVSRGEGEAVVLADGFAEHEPHRHVEIAHHASDHRALLRVLAAKDGEIRLHDVEQLEHNRGHAGEVSRPARAFQRLGDASDADDGRRSWGIHFFRGWQKKQVRPLLFQQHAIALLIARIAREVFGRTELTRIDEDRDDDEVGPVLPRHTDQ